MPVSIKTVERDWILVTDDNLDWAETLSHFLRSRGYTVLVEYSARSALETLDVNTQVSVVISDVRMPELDGFDFLRVVRHRNPAMQIILVTGHEITEDDVVPLGSTILRKPLDFAELLRLLPAPRGAPVGTA